MVNIFRFCVCVCVVCVLESNGAVLLTYVQFVNIYIYASAFYRDVSCHLNYEHRVFNSEEFLKTREPAEKLFYKKVNTNVVQVIFYLLFHVNG